MAKDGAKVAIAARRRAESEEVVRKIKATGGEAMFIESDVTQSGDAERMVAEVVKRYGRLDCSVNNAAVLKQVVLLQSALV
jgi:NAD(P)-dependent dehydrogenase (short-subunit alcohol dehydrogenase family)